jgi:hypothetical protein
MAGGANGYQQIRVQAYRRVADVRFCQFDFVMHVRRVKKMFAAAPANAAVP